MNQQYKRPSKQLHRDFFYLDDEVTINSLSALESGRVDEIVSKTTTAREGGFSGDVTIPVVKAGIGAGRKSSSEIEEEMVRTRTRFSVFDAWYQLMADKKAFGTFDGWGKSALMGVEIGDTVEFRAELSLGPLQTVLRLYLWFAEQAMKKGTLFSQKGAELKETEVGARTARQFLYGVSGDNDDVPILATVVGEDGPPVLITASKSWPIGRLGELSGYFGVIGQVSQIIPDKEEYPVLRLTKDVAPTPLEIQTLKQVVEQYVEPAKALGVDVEPGESVISGPALVLKPIAIYR